MSRKTKKADWFTQALEERGYLIGGLASFRDAYRFTSGYELTARLLSRLSPAKEGAHWPVLVLAGRLRAPKQVEAVEYLAEHELTRTLNALAGRTFAALTYDPVITDQFGVHDGANQGVVSGDDLAKHLSGRLGTQVKGRGTTKRINKSTNDAFQIFTRTSLTNEIVVQDLDALHLEHGLLLEIKRSPSLGLDAWEPFLDDVPNYQALLDFVWETPLRLLTVCINPYEEGRYSLIEIQTAAQNQITYRRLNLSDADQLHLDHPDREWSPVLVSTRRIHR